MKIKPQLWNVAETLIRGEFIALGPIVENKKGLKFIASDFTLRN